jgi:hypothetical protein
MSTHSRIGIENPDGTVTSIYCHFDGYLNGVGRMLQLHYKDRSKVVELISVGNISYLESEVTPPPNKKHTFNSPLPGYTVAYHRDRGDDFSQKQHPTTTQFLQVTRSPNGLTIFAYLFTQENEWYVSQGVQEMDVRKIHVQLLNDIIK